MALRPVVLRWPRRSLPPCAPPSTTPSVLSAAITVMRGPMCASLCLGHRYRSHALPLCTALCLGPKPSDTPPSPAPAMRRPRHRGHAPPPRVQLSPATRPVPHFASVLSPPRPHSNHCWPRLCVLRGRATSPTRLWRQFFFLKFAAKL